ncbi:hypothetical protein EVAR_68368_1 [Eumeta japonica]|uniref:Uncharacterized protein n=1 Tax=Eumeta variegata TaxID=151549 RepID=A0A4C1YYY0_EUMVA|nr:hypothetical protein EVAR_68368_1 [Eumeta japonica]
MSTKSGGSIKKQVKKRKKDPPDNNSSEDDEDNKHVPYFKRNDLRVILITLQEQFFQFTYKAQMKTQSSGLGCLAGGGGCVYLCASYLYR